MHGVCDILYFNVFGGGASGVQEEDSADFQEVAGDPLAQADEGEAAGDAGPEGVRGADEEGSRRALISKV